DRLGPLAGHQHVDVGGKLQRRGHRLFGGVLQRGVVVVGDDEDGHQITPAVFRLATRSAALSTLIPPERFGGSVTLTTLSLGAVSTPSEESSFTASSFFLAFMMLGRLA